MIGVPEILLPDTFFFTMILKYTLDLLDTYFNNLR